MTDLTLSFAALSDIGRSRETNEDAVLVTDLSTGIHFGSGPATTTLNLGRRGALLALSDGMGGHAAGEVASAVVIESLTHALQQSAHGPADERLENAVRAANSDVLAAAKVKNRHGMGATLTAIVVEESGAYIAEVGDSRAYLLRGGQLKQLTRDQSLVQMLVDQGLMSEDEAEDSPRKNILLQAMGLGSDVRAAIGRVELRRADKLLLCSDGISNAVSDDELRSILAANEPSAACTQMIHLANERGGADNLTAVVALVEGSSLNAPFPNETVTGTFSVIKDFGQQQL
ncbi:MAG: PP2C family serine/threonine-protein phosphatase [Polyangiaceae bacterium]